MKFIMMNKDEIIATFAPVCVYWLYACIYQLLLKLPSMQKYRLHTTEEINDMNSVSLAAVLKWVILQQLVQIAVAVLLFEVTSSETNKSSSGDMQPSVLIQAVQIVIAMVVMDAWQYFAHRYMHQNKFLYKHVHSWHHRSAICVFPYAIGAQYNHPIEGLIDTCGGAIAYAISGMTPRTSTVFFCFVVAKAVDDHSGLLIPGNIFQVLFHNNTAYHDTHHQLQGTKYNFSLTFFSIWDKLMGTYKDFEVVRKPRGGFAAKFIKPV